MVKIKKRVLLTSLLVLLILFATKSFWLEIKPINVELEIENAQNSTVEVLLNKKYDNNFLPYRVKKASWKIQENNLHNIVFKISTNKKVQKIRIVFSDLKPQKQIMVSNIRLRLGKCLINREDAFKIDSGELNIQNNKLVILPYNSTLTLDYNLPINTRAPIKFLFEPFVIILILSSLFGYKLMDYIADFSSIKHESRIDIIFLCIFFIVLFIPILHINQKDKSLTENRLLASWKPLINKNGYLNYNFGKDFESWFNDRFNFRTEIINLNTLFRSSVNNIYSNDKAVLDNRYKLLSTQNFYGLQRPKNCNFDKELFSYAKNVNQLQKYCDERNIKLYILIVPRKSDFFEHTVLNLTKNKEDKGDKVVEYLRQNTKVSIIYPKKEMLEANKITPVYFKTDHHWTKKGAYVGYYHLMQSIKKDFPDTPLLEEDSLEKYYDNRVSEHWNRTLHHGQTCDLIGLSSKYSKRLLDTQYLYYKNKNSIKLKREIPKLKCGIKTDNRDDLFYYPEGTNKKLMIIANSFARNLVEFIPYSFKHTLRFYDNDRHLDLNLYGPVIEEYKPDLLVINYHTALLTYLLEPFKNILE